MWQDLRVEIDGQAATKGSKVLGQKKDGNAFMREVSKDLPRFMKAVKTAVLAQWSEGAFKEAFELIVWVYSPRPKSHFHTGKFAGQLRHDAPKWPLVTNKDGDKVQRAVMDALEGIVWENDGYVIDPASKRRYHDFGEVKVVLEINVMR